MTKFNVVYVWDSEDQIWKDEYPTDGQGARELAAQLTAKGYVAYEGRTSIGRPEGPPRI